MLSRPPNDILSRRMVMPSPQPYPSTITPQEPQHQPAEARPAASQIPLDSRHPQWYSRNRDGTAPPEPIPLPEHMLLDKWPKVSSPLSLVLTRVFTALCMIAYGKNDLQNVWDSAVEDGEVWMARIDRMAVRMQATGVIVSSTYWLLDGRSLDGVSVRT